MAAPPTTPVLYRQSRLGDALVEALDELVKGGKLPPDLALKVLGEVREGWGGKEAGRPAPATSAHHPFLLPPTQFDAVFLAALQSKVAGKATFRGRLDTYRFCDGVWTFLLTGATFRLAAGRGRPARDVSCPRIKVVAVDARLAKPTG